MEVQIAGFSQRLESRAMNSKRQNKMGSLCGQIALQGFALLVRQPRPCLQFREVDARGYWNATSSVKFLILN